MTQTVQRILAIVLTGGLLLLTLELVRRKRLMERYALLWLFATAVLIVLAVWKGLLTGISHAVGVHYPPALLFAVAFGFELLLLLHFSLTISRLSDQNKVLAQRSALLEERVRRLEKIEPRPPLAQTERSWLLQHPNEPKRPPEPGNGTDSFDQLNRAAP